MEQSAEINELATALAIAQGQITGALKDSSNPFFRSKYADLASCWDACRKQLSENGLAVIQTTSAENGTVYVNTVLTHKSGQWVRGSLPVKAKDDSPQAQGSGMTYARRYALAAIVGLAQIDDDAEAAQARRNETRGTEHMAVPTETAQQLAMQMMEAMEADTEESVKAMSVYDLHVKLRGKSAEYIAAADQLQPKFRKAWKAYVQMAEKIGNESAALR